MTRYIIRAVKKTALFLLSSVKRLAKLVILSAVMLASLIATKHILTKLERMHTMVVYAGLINAVNNEDELAAIIAHEFAHIELGHTVGIGEAVYKEYQSDMLAIYYMKKAGYNICAAKTAMQSLSDNLITVKSKSHPNTAVRIDYLTFAECKNYEAKKRAGRLVTCIL